MRFVWINIFPDELIGLSFGGLADTQKIQPEKFKIVG